MCLTSPEVRSDAERTAALEQLGLNRQVADGLTQLLGTSEAIRDYEADLRDAGGTTKEVADKQMESMKAKLQILRGRLEDMAITIGSKVLPVLVTLAEFFSDNEDALLAFAAAVGVLSAAIIVLKVQALLAGAGIAIAFLPLTLIIIGIGLLIAAIVLLVVHFDTVRAAAVTTWQAVNRGWQIVLAALKTGAGVLQRFFVRTWSEIRGAAVTTWQAVNFAWQTVVASIKTAAGVLQRFFVRVWSEIRSKAVTTWQAVNSAWQTVVGKLNRAAAAVRRFFVEKWNEIKDRARQIIDAVVGFFRSLPGRLAGIGRDIVEAIMAPIRNLPGMVADVLSSIPGAGVAGNIIGGIGGFLGFQSGGIVPGRFTQPVPLVAHGSEMFLNPRQQANLFRLIANPPRPTPVGPTTGTTINVEVDARGAVGLDPRDLQRTILASINDALAKNRRAVTIRGRTL